MSPNKIIVSHLITCYTAKSRRMISHKPIIRLLKENPGNWQDGFTPMPYRMIISVESDQDLVFTEEHLKMVRRTILLLVHSLPVEYRKTYSYITKQIGRPYEVSNFDIPRAIEYLTIASSRFILDSISLSQNDVADVAFQGTVFPSVVTKKRVSTRLWLMHDLGPSVDPLVITCLGLAQETVSYILLGKTIDLVSILRRKVEKFKAGPVKPDGKIASIIAYTKKVWWLIKEVFVKLVT